MPGSRAEQSTHWETPGTPVDRGHLSSFATLSTPIRRGSFRRMNYLDRQRDGEHCADGWYQMEPQSNGFGAFPTKQRRTYIYGEETNMNSRIRSIDTLDGSCQGLPVWVCGRGAAYIVPPQLMPGRRQWRIFYSMAPRKAGKWTWRRNGPAGLGWTQPIELHRETRPAPPTFRCPKRHRFRHGPGG